MLEIHHEEKMLRLVEDSTIIPSCSLKGKAFSLLWMESVTSHRDLGTLSGSFTMFFFPLSEATVLSLSTVTQSGRW